MSNGKRPRPQRLAEKLLEIRQKIDGGISQNVLIRKMGMEEVLEKERISKYERDILEPPLHVICAYADLANVYLEAIVKDELNLPDELPSKIKSEGIKRNL